MREGWGDILTFMNSFNLERNREGISRAAQILQRYRRAETRALARLADRQRRGLPYNEYNFRSHRDWTRYRDNEMDDDEADRIEQRREQREEARAHYRSREHREAMATGFREARARWAAREARRRAARVARAVEEEEAEEGADQVGG